MRTHKNMFRLPLVALWLIGSLACGTYVGNPEEDTAPTGIDDSSGRDIPEDEIDQKRLIISIADAPIDELSAVNVLISRVSLKPLEGDWIDVELTGTDAINLLDYQDGNKVALASSESIPYGSYNEIRLILDADNPATAQNVAGEDVNIRVPSGESSGLKIKYEFEINEDEAAQLTLDFDLRQSIKATGPNGFMLQPVIRASNDKTSALILGSSEVGSVVCLYESGETADLDTDCESAVGSAKVKGGEFKLAFVEAGTYFVRIFTEEGDYTDSEEFAVTEGEDVQL